MLERCYDCYSMLNMLVCAVFGDSQSPYLIASWLTPHVRGDNARSQWTWIPRHGSPPRAWGQWVALSIPRYPLRFTPTHVGTLATGYLCPG